jgi:hypothetical protein
MVWSYAASDGHPDGGADGFSGLRAMTFDPQKSA